MAKKMLLSSRIDEQVLLTFLILGIGAMVVFGFRFVSHTDCAPVTIQVNSSLIEGKAASFKAVTNAGTSYSWNFGDGEVAEEQSPVTGHVYKHPGSYIVSVLVNGTCDESLPIFVRAGGGDSLAAPVARIDGLKDTVSLKEEIMLSDASVNSTSWVWDLGEPGVSEQYTRNVKFAYQTAGPKKVILTVNGKYMDTKSIYVREKELPKVAEIKLQPRTVIKKTALDLKDNPETSPLIVPNSDKNNTKPEPEPAAIVKIADPPKGYLESVFRGVMSGGEWKEALSRYMCGGDANTPVVYNGNPTTLARLCAGLAALSKKEVGKVSNVKVVSFPSKQTNCITALNVTIDKTTGVWPLKKTTHVDINQ